MADTHVVSLTSGEEWVLNARPKWGVLKRLNTTEDTSEQLALFTVSWSFKDEEGEPIPVSAETIDERDIDEVIEALQAFNSVVLHFGTRKDMEQFSRLVEQTITLRTKSVWWPKLEITRFSDKRYADEVEL